MEQKAIYELLAEHLGDGALGFTAEGLEPWADVAPDKITAACLFLRDDERLDFNQLMCLSGIDWDGYDEAGKGKSVAILGYTEEGQPETSDRVAEGDLGVAYSLFSHRHRHKFTVRVRVPRTAASVPTVAAVWATASWHEREAWDLVGIDFAGHPDLRRMLLEESWVGHPLRKDYQMPGQWEAVPLQGQAYSENPFATPGEASTDQPADDAPAED
jgi:NADH-quinone oxidoreductase subunit C